ncbi:hypothetical protein B0H21DRAFT_881089 [Amylocystis lapponica]|nr:hypothetical protein B0H21DRAFT_881089 [Amylocystis lapponica]
MVILSIVLKVIRKCANVGVVLYSQESSTLANLRDDQWLRGGTTFCGRCSISGTPSFMFNQTTIHFDPATSVPGQGANFTVELENPSSKLRLCVHFTPSVFRESIDYVRRVQVVDLGAPGGYQWREPEFTRLGSCQGCFSRCDPGPKSYSSSFIRLIGIATSQCYEHGFTGTSQQQAVGATGIVEMIATQSTAHYSCNPGVHMLCPWTREHILLCTDDIGYVANDGRITTVSLSPSTSLNTRSRRPCSDAPARGVATYKLVKNEKIILFWSGSTMNLDVLKRARPLCHGCPADTDVLGVVEPETGLRDEDPAVDRVSEVALAIAKEVDRLSDSIEPMSTDVLLMLAGLNSITAELLAGVSEPAGACMFDVWHEHAFSLARAPSSSGTLVLLLWLNFHHKCSKDIAGRLRLPTPSMTKLGNIEPQAACQVQAGRVGGAAEVGAGRTHQKKSGARQGFPITL